MFIFKNKTNYSVDLSNYNIVGPSLSEVVVVIVVVIVVVVVVVVVVVIVVVVAVVGLLSN